MGMFDFIKEAGKRMEANYDLVKEIRSTGIGVEDLTVNLDQGTVTVGGRVQSQEDREKIVLTLGNLQGVEKVEDTLVVEKPATQADFYTVVRGDTLSKIAQRYYGDAMKYQKIFQANQPMLTNPDLIYPGQVLRIPKLEG